MKITEKEHSLAMHKIKEIDAHLMAIESNLEWIKDLIINDMAAELLHQKANGMSALDFSSLVHEYDSLVKLVPEAKLCKFFEFSIVFENYINEQLKKELPPNAVALKARAVK